MFRPILKYIFLNVRTWAVFSLVLMHVDNMRWVAFELVEAESYTLIWQLSCVKLLQVKDIWNALNEGDFVGLSLFDPRQFKCHITTGAEEIRLDIFIFSIGLLCIG